MKKLAVGVAILLTFIVGFFIGSEYTAYKIRNEVKKVFTSAFNPSPAPTIEKEAVKIIEKKMGEEISLTSLKLQVDRSEETQTIASKYSSAKSAKEGAKFVIVNLSVENVTNTEFVFFPDDGLRLVDEKNREFTVYSDSIGNIENYLNSRNLSPNIKESGVLVYEVPKDAEKYSLIVTPSGSNDRYKIPLK